MPSTYNTVTVQCSTTYGTVQYYAIPINVVVPAYITTGRLCVIVSKIAGKIIGILKAL